MSKEQANSTNFEFTPLYPEIITHEQYRNAYNNLHTFAETNAYAGNLSQLKEKTGEIIESLAYCIAQNGIYTKTQLPSLYFNRRENRKIKRKDPCFFIHSNLPWAELDVYFSPDVYIYKEEDALTRFIIYLPIGDLDKNLKKNIVYGSIDDGHFGYKEYMPSNNPYIEIHTNGYLRHLRRSVHYLLGHLKSPQTIPDVFKKLEI